MNLMDRTGYWIWTDYEEVNQYVQFLHKFEYKESCNNNISALSLRISADSQYAVWINGVLAGYGQYADYPSYKVYDTIEIGNLLKSEMNTIAILGYCQNEDSSVYKKGKPGVWFEIVDQNGIQVVHSDASTLCRVAPDYTSGEVDRITPQLSYSFEYNAMTFDHWYMPDYSPGINWKLAATRPNDLILYPRPIAKLEIQQRKTTRTVAQGTLIETEQSSLNMGERMQKAYHAFRELNELTAFSGRVVFPASEGIKFSTEEGNGIYIIVDLEREEAGLIHIELEASEGTLVEIGYGEHLDDMRVRTAVGGRTFAANYICREGRQSFTHYMKRAGCRYIQLHVHSQSFTLYYSGLIPTDYPVIEKGTFHCSDSLHNKIYEVSVRTLLLCMHEHYEDTPWREQALYSLDSRNQMLFGYYCYGEYDFAKASIRLMALSLRDDGLLELCSPAKVPITIPAFSLTWVIQLYEYVLFSGDIAFGREMYTIAKTLMETFAARIDKTGLIPRFHETCYWNFYEWEDGLDGGDIFREYELPKVYDAPLNAFYSIALSAISNLATILDFEEDYEGYINQRKNINETIAKLFWNEQQGVFASYLEDGKTSHYAELTQSLIILCGACPGERTRKVLDALVSEDMGLIPITLSCSIFKYDALLTKPERYGNAVIQQIGQIWGSMLFKGATSFWETIRGADDFDRAGSLCHAWSAVPIYIYYAYILGIKPKMPGYEAYDFKPIDTHILEASGAVPTTFGKYEVTVSKQKGNSIQYFPNE